MRTIILLPSYKPDDKLLNCLAELNDVGFEEFIIIDDGSGDEYKDVFKKAQKLYSSCVVIKHAINMGKGRALKTGFNYALTNYDDIIGVVSCDADGQHAAAAVKNAADAMEANPDKLILGTRNFLKAKNIPMLNFLGNTISILTFKLLCGLSFGDTQCGLRAYSKSIMEKMLKVAGERFEYENIMLLSLRKEKINYHQLPMEAIYIQENKTSHFNLRKDPLFIYLHLLSFAALPVTAGLLAYTATVICFLTLPICSLIRPAMFYAAGLLFGWLIMIIPIPENKNRGYTIIFPILHTLLFSALFFWLYYYQGITLHGAWWLCAIPAAPSAYAIYLNMRYGKKPKRTKQE